jgi:hypothetical protein
VKMFLVHAIYELWQWRSCQCPTIFGYALWIISFIFIFDLSGHFLSYMLKNIKLDVLFYWHWNLFVVSCVYCLQIAQECLPLGFLFWDNVNIIGICDHGLSQKFEEERELTLFLHFIVLGLFIVIYDKIIVSK